MVGGVRQPKVRNLEKISKFLIPPLFTFFGRAGPPSAPGHHTTVASRRFDRRAPSPDRRLHYSVARPTGIAAARLAHQRPVRRPPSSAQVPRTAPTVLTRAKWPYRPRDSHTVSQSLDRHSAHKSRRRHPPYSPWTDGHTPGETRTPSASLSTVIQRTSPVDGTHRPLPGRMALPPARPTHQRPVSRLSPEHKSRRRHPPSPRPADSSSARLPTIHRSPPKKEYSLLGANGIWDSQMVTHFGTSQTRPCLTAGS